MGGGLHKFSREKAVNREPTAERRVPTTKDSKPLQGKGLENEEHRHAVIIGHALGV